MGADYQLSVHKPNGDKLAELPTFEALSLSRSINNVGALSLSLSYNPYRLGYNFLHYPPDTRIVVNRRPVGGAWRLLGDTIWFVRLSELLLSEAGDYIIKIVAYDTNTLLNRRIVAYDAGTAQADKTAESDAMMKAIMRENYGSLATDTDRDISTYLSVDADLTAGTTPSISKAFSRRAVLNTLQEIAQASATEGSYLAFDIVANGPDQFAFRTFPNQRGQDRRWPDGISPFILSPERRNLSNIQRVDDHTAEATFVYAGGQGEGSSRLVATASDPVRIAQSPFGRIETWKDARNTGTAAALQDEADSELRARRPRLAFAAKVIDSPYSSFDLHYHFGDFITAEFGEARLDCRLDAFKVDVGDNGESIDINLRVEGDIGG